MVHLVAGTGSRRRVTCRVLILARFLDWMRDSLKDHPSIHCHAHQLAYSFPRHTFSFSKMSGPVPSAAYRCCQLAARTQKRSLSSQCLRLSSTSSANQPRRRNSLTTPSRRWQSTDAAAGPTNPKIAGIVDQISQLTLLETADLVASLKVDKQILLHVQ